MSGRTRAEPREGLLVVGGEAMERVSAVLSRTRYRVEKVPDARTAVLLAQRMRYQYLVVRYPVPDLDFERFVTELRRAPSPSLTARLMLVAGEDRLEEAGALRDEGLIAGAVSLTCADEELEAALTSFMKTAPRVGDSFPVRIYVVGSETEAISGENVNLSESGVLVRTDAKLPPGTAVEVALEPRRPSHPIVARAVVVRAARPESERVRGLGLQFTGFEGDSRERLAICIRGLLAEVLG